MAPTALTRRSSQQARPLDTADMQGLVARAYGHLPFARYLLLGIEDPAGARAWLTTIVDDVTTADDRPDLSPETRLPETRSAPCLNLAFTWHGLGRIGLSPDTLTTFPRPLQEGIVEEHRSRILGDTGDSDPSRWRWGGPASRAIDLVLFIYAASEADLDRETNRRRSEFSPALVVAGDAIEGRVLDGGKEHFGFTDGLSQPTLKGWPRPVKSARPPVEDPSPPKWAEVNPGEVVLGYDDNFGQPSVGPTVAARDDPEGRLPEAVWDQHGRRHLGANGSFLVFRQLAQDVAGFHRFLDEAAAAAGDPAVTRELVGAKVVGRWANGTPLALAPTPGDQSAPGANDFGYHDADGPGLRCPVGAHIRRANPRDSGSGNPDKALSSTKNHRILRRGRPYGLPVPAGEEPTGERGLLFMCLNADIERQFEFVQHTWLNNPYFAGLYHEVDPLVGNQPPEGGTFTVPADPVRRPVTGLGNFVTVKGAGYFFLPGVLALRYLGAGPPGGG